MIITLTLNPSIDRTMRLGGALVAGGVFRATSVENDVGGKGVNVARAIAQAGEPVAAVLPAEPGDPLVAGLESAGVHALTVAVGHPARVNITVAEPDGTTTKLNDPGLGYPTGVLEQLTEHITQRSHPGDWVVLSGSLPPGVPDAVYADLTTQLNAGGRRVALDTSGAPLTAAMHADQRPALVKPNAEELASLTGHDPAELEADTASAVGAAHALAADGAVSVLLTLGAAGAALVTRTDAWLARPAPTTVLSTVGAGDAALAGYLLGELRGMDPADCLASAVAHGSAAAALPGTTMPRPSDLRLDGVTVTAAALPTRGARP